jgi:hypothetical protein
MHDETVEGVIRQLRDDLSIPEKQITKLTFVIPLHVGRLGGVMRRVQEVAMVENARDLKRIASWDISNDSFDVLSDAEQREALAGWAGMTVENLEADLEKREGFLTTLLNTGVSSIPEVNAAIEGFYEEVIRPRPRA